MRSPWSRLCRDPIVHFTAAGAALFALHALVSQTVLPPAAAPVPAAQIVIPAARVAGLTESWAQAWGRPPTESELGDLVEEEVRTEILAREAAAQGLDRDDEYIRQHLRERLEVLVDAGGSTVQPTEAELEAFYAANRSRFGAGPVVSFRQVLLDPQPGGEALSADAAALLERLRAGEEPVDLAAVGGSSLELPATFDDVPEGDVAAMFGASFAHTLLTAPPGRWVGPVISSYGQHLVRLDARAEATGLPFAEVRENVREEWLAARTAARRDRHYRDLRQRYTVTIERSAQPSLAAATAP